MKKAAAVLLIIVFALLAACQATPESDIVVQKDLEQMIEQAQSTPRRRNAEYARTAAGRA